MAAGIVYLRTNRFEVKLEGITFKARDFDSVCSSDFLFPDGKIWSRPPIVGIDVMRHPRDPSIVLMLLCFGIGCVILRFHAGESLPGSIYKFLTNERIQFVGFGIPEKQDLFPFEEMGLNKNKVDIGYLAAKILGNAKYKRSELAELARKVLRVKTMIGLTEASSFERHEQIKCGICQLFITWAISMVLLRTNTNDNKTKKSPDNNSPRKPSFLKNLNSLPNLTDGWFKSPKIKKENDPKAQDDLYIQTKDDINYDKSSIQKNKGPSWNTFIQATIKAGDFLKEQVNLVSNKDSTKGNLVKTKSVTERRLNRGFNDNNNINGNSPNDKPLKGILKCPSNSIPQTPKSGLASKPSFRRSVSFKELNERVELT